MRKEQLKKYGEGKEDEKVEKKGEKMKGCT